MNRIAMFISGRLNCYETDLYPMLMQFSQQSNLQIDLFCALNCERTEYYQKAEEMLSPWLKGIEYELYSIPDDFLGEIAKENNQDERTYLHTLSMFYNDKKAFAMIAKYAEDNQISYTLICKFRADIHLHGNFIFPNLNPDDNTIYCGIPPCSVFYKGILDPRYRQMTDAFAFGTPSVMKHYCKTYDFILKTMRERNYRWHLVFELTLSESFYDLVIEDMTYDECSEIMLKHIQSFKYPRVDFECPYKINPTRTQKRV